MIKPKISKYKTCLMTAPGWKCSGWNFIGYGQTPSEAYFNWKNELKKLENCTNFIPAVPARKYLRGKFI